MVFSKANHLLPFFKKEEKNKTDYLETTKTSGEDFGACKKNISHSRNWADL